MLWHLTNISSHATSGCRYIPFAADLRTATGQALRYAITKRSSETCFWDEEFRLPPGGVTDWVEPLGDTVLFQPIVSGEAVLTLVRSSFAHPARDPHCTLNLPVFGVPPDERGRRPSPRH
ncbi:MAG TPA: hypothetical protein VGX68_12440 [Thermoanaerobaculia bacterium]|nr:hypothetical protein [Thermoanaerobaculia bacterium]